MGSTNTPNAAATPPNDDNQAVRAAAIVIIIVMSIAALKVGRPVVLPVVMAVLFSLLLSTPVRWLRKRRVPERFGAAIVVFGALGLVVAGGALLFRPAIDWIARAPETISKVDSKIRAISKPIVALQQSADKMATVTTPAAVAGKPTTQVQLQTPGLFETVGLQTLAMIPTALSVIFLTYFLLASGPLFRRKIVQILPGKRDVQHFETILGEIELQTSKFLSTATMINAGVGLATGLALWAARVPGAFLWGGVAAVLNFVPYLGPITTVTLIALASLASFDDVSRALIAPACFGVIHLVENNLITPTLLGRRLPVNTVAIFLGLIFFGWIWGIPGAVLAVPLTTVVKVACDHIPALNNFGELLGN